MNHAKQEFGYDDTGNLKSKTGVGSYDYGTQGAGAVRPHAVKSAGTLGAFVYDDNGNLTSGAGREARWTSFDMPSYIAKGGATSSFAYGPEHQRTRQDRSDGTSVVYAGAQETEIREGKATVKTYWPNGIGVEIDRPGAAASELNWVHEDRLGSPVAISGSDGVLREKLAYDAWGKRRQTDGAAASDALDGKTDNRGFTGHEMLDTLDLVHMNGRVYDPLLARFLSADPIIQYAENGQSHNRFSYVLNNPLNLTDPSGYSSCQAPNNCDSGAVEHQVAEQDKEALQKTQAPPQVAVDKASAKNGTPASKERAIVSDSQKVLGHSNDGSVTVVERRIVREPEAQKVRPSRDEIMGSIILLSASAIPFERPLVWTYQAGRAWHLHRLAKLRLARNGSRGRAAEGRVLDDIGMPKNTQTVSTAEGEAIPDALSDALSVEIKDTIKVNLTKQLRIQTEAARASGRQSVLITGEKNLRQRAVQPGI